jgi:hypothetical protein
MARWNVSYTYVNPHPAGPFRGRAVIEREDKPQRGEIIYAMMGRAAIKTVSRATKYPTIVEVREGGRE